MSTIYKIPGLQIDDPDMFLCLDGNREYYALFSDVGEAPQYPLFEGTDYKPSILHDYESLESAACLAVFLSATPRDTEASYFEGRDFAPEQIHWRDHTNGPEALALWAYKIENEEEE